MALRQLPAFANDSFRAVKMPFLAKPAVTYEFLHKAASSRSLDAFANHVCGLS